MTHPAVPISDRGLEVAEDVGHASGGALGSGPGAFTGRASLAHAHAHLSGFAASNATAMWGWEEEQTSENI